MTPPPPGEDSTTTEVRLGVAAERSLQLAAELHYPDGTSAVGEPSPVRVLTAATQARELAAWRAKEARLLDVLERMKHALPDPCADPAATLAWLRQQPGVEFAAASSDGHSISLSTGSGPSALWCHSH